MVGNRMNHEMSGNVKEDSGSAEVYADGGTRT